MTTTKEIQSKEDSPSLSDAQKFVGGWVEVVQVNDGVLIIDEEGKLKDKPVNEVASKMYADKYGDEDIIVGDAIYIPHKIPSEWHG
jgi:acyl CoA:acetate/3-ketoacid CoA transferase